MNGKIHIKDGATAKRGEKLEMKNMCLAYILPGFKACSTIKVGNTGLYIAVATIYLMAP